MPENDSLVPPSENLGSANSDVKKSAKPPVWLFVSGLLLLVSSLVLLYLGLRSNTLTPERTGVYILVLFASATIVVSRFLPKDLIDSLTKVFEVLKSTVLIFIFSLLMFEEGKDFFRRAFFKELPVNVSIKIFELKRNQAGERETFPLNDYSLILIWEGKNKPPRDTLKQVPSDTTFLMNLGTDVTGVSYFIVKDGCGFIQGDIFKPAIIDANRNLPILATLVCK